MRQKSILFVCTGNVFRSVSAEYSLKKYLSEHNISDWKVSSAGIVAKKEPIDYKTLEVLKELGIKNIRHKQKKLTKDMVNEYDIVIAMAENHLNFIRSKLKYPKAILFNELAIGKKNSIWDIEDDVKDYKTDRQAVEKKIEKTVKEIRKKIPKLFKNLDGGYVVSSRIPQQYGEILAHIKKKGICPFCCETHPHMIYENEHMYVIPARAPYVQDHLLIIPKRHVVLLQDMNHPETQSLHKMVDVRTKKLHRKHPDVNLLLRDGPENGKLDKSVNHLHFHLIPDCSITENTGKGGADRCFLDEKDYAKVTQTIKKKYT